MIRRNILKGALILMLATLGGCSKPETPPAPVEAPAAKPTLAATGLDVPPDTVRVSLMTSEGEIVLDLDGKHAPNTTANFLHYVDTKKLDGGTFYRAVKAGPAGFVQFNASGFTYPPIPHESTKQTGLSHTDGTISTARYAVGTASNEFTICIGDMTYLDAGGKAMPDGEGFAAFGHVVSGMDVLKRILHSHISDGKPAQGNNAGETLAKPVTILSAKRV